MIPAVAIWSLCCSLVLRAPLTSTLEPLFQSWLCPVCLLWSWWLFAVWLLQSDLVHAYIPCACYFPPHKLLGWVRHECAMLLTVYGAFIVIGYLWFRENHLVQSIYKGSATAPCVFLLPSSWAPLSPVSDSDVMIENLLAYMKQLGLSDQILRRMAALLTELCWTMRLLSCNACRCYQRTWGPIDTYPIPFGP